jgi:hypothetical protein
VRKNYFDRIDAGRIDVMNRSGSTTGIIAGGVLSGGSRPEDWDRRIKQHSEQLYRAKLVWRLLLTWMCPGNVVLVAAAITAFTAVAGLRWWAVPAVVVPVASVVASARLLYRQHFKVRGYESELRELRRAQREDELEELGADVLAAHKRYRARVPEIIDEYRAESRKHRWRYTFLQGIVMVGSILASTAMAASLSIPALRWTAMTLSVLVAVSATFAGFAKYRERSVSLQQAADSLEREYESVELRVGRYRRFGDEREAYAEFANEAEALREDQAKRQQQLGHEVSLSVSAQ